MRVTLYKSGPRSVVIHMPFESALTYNYTILYNLDVRVLYFHQVYLIHQCYENKNRIVLSPR